MTLMSHTSKRFFIPLLCGIVQLMILSIHADESGFISIDCGGNSNYTEITTKLKYISDAGFIDSGETKSILKEYNRLYQQPYWSLRSFPEGDRNCYKINVTKNTKYLIRACFVYGNYDGRGKLPEFQLYLGPELWDTIKFDDVSTGLIKEIIHISLRNYVHVCLVNTGHGVPFISTIELRPLPTDMYETPTGSLVLVWRFATGLTTNHRGYRYPVDIYDRLWYAPTSDEWAQLNTSSPIIQNEFKVPPTVMCTAATPKNPTDPLTIVFVPPEGAAQNAEYYRFLHFAEIEVLQANQSRWMNLTQDGVRKFGPFSPPYLTSQTFQSTTAWSIVGQAVNISVVRTENSTLPPILNALEIFMVKNFTVVAETDQDDVEAMVDMKRSYRIGRNWQGDPCAPQNYLWEGVKCIHHEFESPRIISLNLSASGLTGEIAPYISNLTMIVSLDLSNNNLTGSIPEFLSELQALTVIKLGKNNLTGSIPLGLIDKMNNGLLLLSLCGNPNLSGNVSCKLEKSEKKQKFIIPLVASLVGASVLLLLLGAVWWWSFKRKREKGVGVTLGDVKKAQMAPQYASLESAKRKFTYSQILSITNNLERVLGRGGFGAVYHGYMENTQVAVKMLSPSSVQGFQQFQAEVDLLMRVHHINLTSLVGYCKDATHLGLVYEYMANGNLSEHLSEGGSNVFTWEGRLQIAIDAAHGLEYLHDGCRPPIMHRDVKTTNILLNEKFQAKLSDFGLSRKFRSNDGTQVSSLLAGTPGYLDPEFYRTNRLNEKSDVYSFGVVLLEIITSQPAISRTQERIHISQWVGFELRNGDISSIVDPRLEGMPRNTNSVWKAVEIAMACVSTNATKRPTMSQVVVDLKECLATEQQSPHVPELEYSTELLANDSIAMLTPSVR